MAGRAAQPSVYRRAIVRLLVALVTGLPQTNWPRHSTAIWLFHRRAVRYTVSSQKKGENHARNSTTHPFAPLRTACRLCHDAARHRVRSCIVPGHAVAKAQRLTRPQCGGHRIPVRPLLEVFPMFLHDPAIRAAYPNLHVGLLLLRHAHRLDLESRPDDPAHADGSAHPVARLCATFAAEAGLSAAVFDLDRIAGTLHVRFADGSERFEDIGGGLSHPEAGEVIFVDAAGRVHSRDWNARRSPHSVLSEGTHTALVVVQVQQAEAGPAVRRLLQRLASVLQAEGGAVETFDLAFHGPRRPDAPQAAAC